MSRRLSLFCAMALTMLLTCLMTACDVHELPETPENETFVIRLTFDNDYTPWHHTVEKTKVTEVSLGDPAPKVNDHGVMRYIMRAYPQVDGRAESQDNYREFVFDKSLDKGYDHILTAALPAGSYSIMVWADMRENPAHDHFYCADNFVEITLQGDHRGCNDWRDGYRGTADLMLTTSIMVHTPDTLDILMQRPMAKYEFVTTDLKEFIDKEVQNAQARGDLDYTAEGPARVINPDDYQVRVYYAGYMPNTYNMFLDKPVDSATGVSYPGKFTQLNEDEASIAFDHVFVNGKNASVTTQVALYNKRGELLSLTDPINIPLMRNRHTILRGSFLMQESSKGLVINPDFDGDHTIIVP